MTDSEINANEREDHESMNHYINLFPINHIKKVIIFHVLV